MMEAAHTLALVGTVIVMGMALWRAFKGPRVHDRIVAVNLFGTTTVLAIALMGFVAGRPDMYVDIALVYALINFIGTLAVLKFTHYPDKGWETDAEQGDI